MELNIKYKNQIVEDKIEEHSLDKYDFSNATFVGVNVKGKSFRYCNFLNLTINNKKDKKTDFSGADLTSVSNFDTVKNLNIAIFNDDSILEDLDLEKLAKHDPITAHKLKQIRYVGRFKGENKRLYKIWKISCDCGRSWNKLLIWAILSVFCFGIFFYFCGKSSLYFLPHISFIKGSNTLLPLSFFQSMQFSALSFVGFNMPEVTWNRSWTGFWVVAETWLGLAFLGMLVTVISTRLVKND